MLQYNCTSVSTPQVREEQLLLNNRHPMIWCYSLSIQSLIVRLLNTPTDLTSIARFCYMKSIAYFRVSTICQRDEGASLDMQRERIMSWCAMNDCSFESSSVEVMSGGRADNRPPLQKAILRPAGNVAS